MLVTLYMAGVTSPQIILHELTILEFVIPIAVIFLILYYQCKYSGVPQARYTESKTRTLTMCLFIWSVLRILQSWNGLYASRQFLGMSLLLSGYSYESYLFVPFILILQCLFLEIFPYLYVLDQNFISKMTERAQNSSLVEPLFEAIPGRSQLNISNLEQSMLPSSQDHYLNVAHYSPNTQMTPSGVPMTADLYSEASSVADFPFSAQLDTNRTTNLGSFAGETVYSNQSF